MLAALAGRLDTPLIDPFRDIRRLESGIYTTAQRANHRLKQFFSNVSSGNQFLSLITLLGTKNNNTQGAGSSISVTHDLTSGSNRIAIVFVHQTYYNASELITGVTYGGVAMTQIGGGSGDRTNVYRNISAWYLLEASLPANGTKTVVATFGASVLTSAISVFTIQNAKQAAYEQTPTPGTYLNASSSASSIAITTVAANAWAFSCGASENNTTFTHGTGQTEITDVAFAGGTPCSHSVSYEEIATPGSNTQVDTAGSSGRMVGIAFSFAPL